MKINLIISTILILVFSTLNLSAVVKKPSVTTSKISNTLESENEDLNQLSKIELEERLERKPSLKEKLTLNFLQKKLRKHFEINDLQTNEDAKINGFAIAGFVCSFVGLFVAGIPLGILGIVFSTIALSKIKRNPETMKGKGFAIAGQIIGVAAILGAVIFLAVS